MFYLVHQVSPHDWGAAARGAIAFEARLQQMRQVVIVVRKAGDGHGHIVVD